MLDVGCGYGTWGVLLRQHLEEEWRAERGRLKWDRRIEGVEVWEGYRNPLWELFYDRVGVGDAHDFLQGYESKSFDLALCIEVLEHLSPEQGKHLVEELQRIATHVLLTTPDYAMPQEALLGNPYERHHSWWSWKALKKLGSVGRLPASGSTVALFSSRPSEIAGWLRGASLRTLGPLVPHRIRRNSQIILHWLGLHPGPPQAGEGAPVTRAK